MTGEIAAHLCNSLPENLGGHRRRRLTRLGGDNGDDIGIQHLASGLLGFPTGKVSQAQQTHRQRRQEAQQAFQPVNTLHLTVLLGFN